MATYKTYDQVGKAEDVSSLISNISPFDRPFSTSIKDEKCRATTFQWQEDALETAGVNAAVEGADATIGTLSATTLRDNATQIMSKAFQVSATADVVETHGRAKETAYQLSKALKALGNDQEFAYIGQDQAKVAGNGTTARKMASFSQQIDSSVSVDAGANATDALTEAKILDLGQALYESGATPSVLMVKPSDSEIIAGFTASSGRTRNFNDETRTLTNVIDVLVTPYGQYKVVLNRHQKSTHAFLYDPNMVRSVTLRPATRTLLAKNGDSDKHFIVQEVSLKHMNFKGSGMITGLA